MARETIGPDLLASDLAVLRGVSTCAFALPLEPTEENARLSDEYRESARSYVTAVLYTLQQPGVARLLFDNQSELLLWKGAPISKGQILLVADAENTMVTPYLYYEINGYIPQQMIQEDPESFSLTVTATDMASIFLDHMSEKEFKRRFWFRDSDWIFEPYVEKYISQWSFDKAVTDFNKNNPRRLHTLVPLTIEHFVEHPQLLSQFTSTLAPIVRAAIEDYGHAAVSIDNRDHAILQLQKLQKGLAAFNE